jgi:drug/metabolite transporter (DMT)-like permease
MRTLELRSHRAAVWVALLVTVLWSSSWVLIRWGLDEEGLTPLTFSALRYGIAAIVLVAWVIFRERHRYRDYHVSRGFLVRLVLLGVVFYTVTQGAMFVALSQQPAATTSLVLSLTPLFVAAGAAISLSEVPSRWQFGGAMLVALGAWLYFAGDLGATGAGLVAAVVALGANVVSTLLGRGINRSGQLPPVTVTAISMGIGAGLLVFVGVGAEGVPDVSARGWLLIGWLAIVNTALAFTLWNLSLRRLSALESAGINNTMLIQIAVLAWLFLGEMPGLIGVAGIVLVSGGVYLTQMGKRSLRTRHEKEDVESSGA